MREDFKQRLFNVAVRQASFNSYKFSEITAADLVKFINEGVNNMSTTDYNSGVRKQVAEDNLIRFVDAMNKNGKIRRLTESLDSSAFNSAKSIVCPLWPFC